MDDPLTQPMPDDAYLDRFRPHLPQPDAAVTSPDETAGPAQPVTTWDEWSLVDRDRRERRSLVTRIRGNRGAQGLAHERAVTAHRSRVRTAATVTVAVTTPLVVGWFWVIGARDASITLGSGDRSFAPFGFLLLVVTALAGVALLRWWAGIYRDRPDPLRFDPLPDSPEAPRHGSFDGSTTPPTRW
ncbi:hypothetical protein SAMN05216410_1418 [Sanguibacter gelidistatuariae]|uniref:Uncharacterized protein n=1 Tax=Sanguibacter gelidistatuariae TaxID=1814289 RepID=A0A1G6JU84_9MICO|nr:hypothetical protein [Sanguibacter gelidistatuariae]SDC22312.1 hypothetical protein SAMN05216410_1418 [Sanguibacter gelidistatuariae]